MPSTLANIRVKRAYDAPSKDDRARVLVDRLWPRGLTKDELQLTAWLRDLAPSNELRKWFHAHTEQGDEFRKRYIHELQSAAAAKAVDQLRELAGANEAVTLLFASKQLERNNATVLKEFIENEWKPRQEAATKKHQSRRKASLF